MNDIIHRTLELDYHLTLPRHDPTHCSDVEIQVDSSHGFFPIKTDGNSTFIIIHYGTYLIYVHGNLGNKSITVGAPF
jgi:hypothetical protein